MHVSIDSIDIDTYSVKIPAYGYSLKVLFDGMSVISISGKGSKKISKSKVEACMKAYDMSPSNYANDTMCFDAWMLVNYGITSYQMTEDWKMKYFISEIEDGQCIEDMMNENYNDYANSF